MRAAKSWSGLMSVFVMSVERMSAPAVLGRRVVSTAVTAVTTNATVGRVYLVSLASKLTEPAGERTSATTHATTDVWIISEISTDNNLKKKLTLHRYTIT
jgi:hypothetical protein